MAVCAECGGGLENGRCARCAKIDAIMNPLEAPAPVVIPDAECFAAVQDTIECPRCAEKIKARAKVCRFCEFDLEAPAKERSSGRQPRSRRRLRPTSKSGWAGMVIAVVLLAAVGYTIWFFWIRIPFGLSADEWEAVKSVASKEIVAAEARGHRLTDDEIAELMARTARIAKERRDPNIDAPTLKRARLSRPGGDAPIVIYNEPPGGRPLLLGFAAQGEPCDILESITVIGCRWFKVRVSGKDLGAPGLEHARAYLSVTDVFADDEAGRTAKEAYDSVRASTFVGWTRWVAADE